MAKSAITIETPSGQIQGNSASKGHNEFLGIRYATAKRFESPVDIESWDGVLEANQYGSICPQVPGVLEMMLGFDESTMNEDCLFLNVYAPAEAASDSKLPVLFWVHGGAFTNGAGSLAWYDGGSLTRRDAVVVTINYRLGAFGFLGDGNFGTLDMISALRWVHRNISSFGGDPSNVTIFGESAGGSGVISLMAAPEAQNFFHKVWSMSPSIGQLRDQKRAVELEAQFLSIAEVDSREKATLLSVKEILDAQTKQMSTESRAFDFFAPTAGGSGLDTDILHSASTSVLPVVVGTNRDENRLWSAFDPNNASATEEIWKKFCVDNFGDQAIAAQKIYESIRPGDSPGQLMSAVATDTSFRQRAISYSNSRLSHKVPTWMYWFTWASPAFDGAIGCCHALDIPFAFDNLDSPGTDMFTGAGSDRAAVAERFANEIVRFATHGHPSWAQYDFVDRSTLVMGTTAELVKDPEAEIRQLFQN
jgi:para-nitrobenzyl esterase